MIYPLNNIPEDKLRYAGGKARSLSHMFTHTKIRIPEGYVLLAGETATVSDLEKLSKSCTYAVRSSAISEDGENASYAGQYETVTDVKFEDIPEAIKTVQASARNERVQAYSDGTEGVAVVIQRFVKPEFAGVVFTSDVITGKDEELVGNYVRGEGEQLVSGAANAEEFRINAIKYAYSGPAEFAPYAKKLGKYCQEIRRLYGMPMDIEWAVSGGVVYILQARPITTLRRLDPETYEVNGTKSGYKLLTRTNVGEIFMKPVSPMTFSVLEKINDMLGLPDWLDNINGQAYMNISEMCSIAVAFGKTREEAFEAMKELAGNVPEGIEVPISPFDKKAFWGKMKVLFFPKEKCKLTKKQKREMVRDLPDIARAKIEQIRAAQSNEELLRLWDNELLPQVKDCFASILGVCGTQMVPLFGTRKKIAKVAGEQMADRLCGGCLGVVESMKPMLLIDDVIAGRLSKEEYVKICGHRSPSEMELMSPRPYEDPSFPDNVIEERRASGVDMYAMLEAQNKAYEEALAEFKAKYPGKSKWIDKQVKGFAGANAFREEIRSKGVYIFCVFREFLLRAGVLNGLGDDVFMFMWDELFESLRAGKMPLEMLRRRRETYEGYLKYPNFPNIVMGRFEPDEWVKDPDRRADYYVQDMKARPAADGDIKGFAGAAGKVRGRVVVIDSVDNIGLIKQGDILVTTATNIGWTPAFSKVSAIVTDIGAPLSHAAIVAREFGIPAVVGCGNATMLLKTGDEVEVDGAAGVVRKVHM